MYFVWIKIFSFLFFALQGHLCILTPKSLFSHLNGHLYEHLYYSHLSGHLYGYIVTYKTNYMTTYAATYTVIYSPMRPTTWPPICGHLWPWHPVPWVVYMSFPSSGGDCEDTVLRAGWLIIPFSSRIKWSHLIIINVFISSRDDAQSTYRGYTGTGKLRCIPIYDSIQRSVLGSVMTNTISRCLDMCLQSINNSSTIILRKQGCLPSINNNGTNTLENTVVFQA